MSNPARFGGVTEAANPPTKARLCGSARLTYTICAFLAMVVHLCLRNTLNLVIMCMVKQESINNLTKRAYFNEDCGPADIEEEQRTGTLSWTRSQEFYILGAFYFGYVVTLPIAGILSDKFGGRLFFIHSITVQAVVFMLIPIFAEISYVAAFVVRVVQGLIAGCSNPALYQLFSIWAHPTERTAFLAIAYGGYSVGSLIAFPISSYFCNFGWKVTFYCVGSVALFFGICCHWLVYNTLEEHPRLSREEYDYLKASHMKKPIHGIPWRSILTSVPVYAFIFTHAFHIYGVMVFTLVIPRFFKEAMGVPMDHVGLASTAPFFGSIISKLITIFSCSFIEQMPSINLTRFRRIVFVVCNFTTIVLILGIIFSSCSQNVLVAIISLCVGISTDVAFSGAYWPSLLYVAPAFSGLISGFANSLATVSGALAPIGISLIVKHGMKEEWNTVLCTLIASYIMATIVYGLFGSSKLADWGKGGNNQ